MPELYQMLKNTRQKPSGGWDPPLPQGIDESLGLSLPDGKNPPVPKTALQIAQGMGGDVVVNLLGADAVQP